MRFTFLLGAALSFSFSSVSAHASVGGTEVKFKAEDGVEVCGTFTLPPGDIFSGIPAVLLVHGGGQDRTEWATLQPQLVDRGWATLAIDLRGHGATGGQIKDWRSFFNDADGAPNDVAAAMEFLDGHESIDGTKIAVVGSSVGGNLACVAIQKLGACGGVFMSGKTEAAQSLAGEKLDHLHSLLFIAGEKEQGGARARWAKELEAMSSGSSRALIVAGSSKHGAALLEGNDDLADQIVHHLGGVIAGSKFKKVEFPSADGLMVTAEMYGPHPVSAPWIVVSHQAGWSRGEYRGTAPRLTALGFNVLALDQRSGGAVNEVLNETAARAKAKGLPMAYLDAEPDILAGIAWARDLGAGKVLLLGSSYSASLALKIAGEHPKAVDAVVSLSPGEYFGRDQPKLIETAAKTVAVPVFVSSAKDEADDWAAMFAAIPGPEGTLKWGFVPAAAGQHGSRALWSKFEGSRALWYELTTFLLQQR